MNYTIKQIRSIDDIDHDLTYFFFEGAQYLNKIVGHKFEVENFDFLHYARNHLFLVAYRNGKPVGTLMARLYLSIFDGKTRILMQDILYTLPDSGRACWLLLQSFIAFGRENADHIFTMRTENTNIKPESLEKLGFEDLETLYRLET